MNIIAITDDLTPEVSQLVYVTNLGHLFKLWRKHLTVCTPRSIEVDDPRLTASEHVTAELGRIKTHNTAGHVLKQPGTQ